MMKELVKGKIFLAEERGLNETEWFCSQTTFNFGKYFNEHKAPFGDLYVLNDDMLAGGRSVSMSIEEDSYVIILPLSGAVVFKRNSTSSLVAAGQVIVNFFSAGERFGIKNPFQNDTINFLQIWIKAGKKNDLSSGALTYQDVNKDPNELIKIFPGNVFAESHQFSISIGKFSGRGGTVYNSKTKKCFLFILSGAFEVEGRLLHERDGLALWNTNKIEMEALSNDAMILVIEL